MYSSSRRRPRRLVATRFSSKPVLGGGGGGATNKWFSVWTKSWWNQLLSSSHVWSRLVAGSRRLRPTKPLSHTNHHTPKYHYYYYNQVRTHRGSNHNKSPVIQVTRGRRKRVLQAHAFAETTTTSVPSLPLFGTLPEIPFTFSSPYCAHQPLYRRTITFAEYWQRVHTWWNANWAVVLLHVGSICTLIGFTRTDVLELRLFSFLGNVSGLVFQIVQPTVRLVTVAWTTTFASVNGYKMVGIVHERHRGMGVFRQATHEAWYTQYFLPHGVTPRQFATLLQCAHTVHVPKGQVLIRKGQALTHVYLIVQGRTRANVLGRYLSAISFDSNRQPQQTRQASSANTTTTIPPSPTALGDSGAWVGEMAFLEHYWNKTMTITKKPSTATPQPNQPEPTKTTTTMTTNPSTPWSLVWGEWLVPWNRPKPPPPTVQPAWWQSWWFPDTSTSSRQPVDSPKPFSFWRSWFQDATTATHKEHKTEKDPVWFFPLGRQQRPPPPQPQDNDDDKDMEEFAKFMEETMGPMGESVKKPPRPQEGNPGRPSDPPPVTTTSPTTTTTATTTTPTALFSIVAQEDCTVLVWSHEDLERVMAQSTDLRAALTRAMTAAIVGKVIHFTVHTQNQRLPSWSTWLDDWKHSAAATVQVVPPPTAPTTATATTETATSNDASSETTKGISN